MTKHHNPAPARRHARKLGLACILLVLPAVSGCIELEKIATGLDRPLWLGAAPGDDSRLFIVENTGRIKILNVATGEIKVFMDLSDLISTLGSEEGLLGMAFHPDFRANRKFYVTYTAKDSSAYRLVEYCVKQTNQDQADLSTARPILSIELLNESGIHHGGWLAFHPKNGYLYLSVGDGGLSPNGITPEGEDFAQQLTGTLRGKLLRIDVGGDDFPKDNQRNYAIPKDNPFVGKEGEDEIWAYGLRNPWRCSFDRQTCDLYIGDVGQTFREEIDFQPAASKGGENYGWRLREGAIPTPLIGGPKPEGAIDPIYNFRHRHLQGLGQSGAVVGGYVYRGPIKSLQGKYFFGDFTTGRVWSLRHNGKAVTEVKNWTQQFNLSQPDPLTDVSSFGEDNAGNLYIVSLSGCIYKIVEAERSFR